MEPKFKPCDIVRVKGISGTKLSIKESLVQTCPGGTQIHYTGRLIVKSKYQDDGIHKDDWKFLEHELEALDVLDKKYEEISGVDPEDEKAQEKRLEVLKHEDSYMRVSSIFALGRTGDESSVEPLVEVLVKDCNETKACAAFSLGEIGSGKAVEALSYSLKVDKYDNVKEVLNKAPLFLYPVQKR